MRSIGFKILFHAIAAVTILTKGTGGFSASASSSPSSSSSPIPPPPPISVPVWSFATPSSQSKTSMNIMTFCIPVSVSSPKLWALSFYHGTLTKDSFFRCLENKNAGANDQNERSVGVLQLLKYDHRHLVPILGKKSGRDVDKSTLCSEEGFPWSRDDTAKFVGDAKDRTTHTDLDLELLPGCALYVRVECNSSERVMDAGDHVVAFCQVTGVGVWEEQTEKDGGRVKWLDAAIDNETTSLALGAIDESNALYSGQLRKEGIL